jgi:hypothetical protein
MLVISSSRLTPAAEARSASMSPVIRVCRSARRPAVCTATPSPTTRDRYAASAPSVCRPTAASALAFDPSSVPAVPATPRSRGLVIATLIVRAVIAPELLAKNAPAGATPSSG